MIDGRGGWRRMRGRLDMVDHLEVDCQGQVWEPIGWKKGIPRGTHSMVLKTFLRVSKTVTRLNRVPINSTLSRDSQLKHK